ncbi:hypothetical protein GGR20_002461 [Devosia subaequoris]|uniref:DUF945 domain-containing protein n=1 Tax=Devosia subaequoris TaxID=395930 RepID=A0A7W6NCD6_9HYPH|nr:hypothetical protein [Devosia subaequoris]MBB4052813.1 hypothetical protein [Devosia subaequoris]MCP1209964.1 hypothetical protein [Devosia subaequoris]
MIRTIKTTSLMTATGLAAFAFMQPAMALDAQTFLDRIEAVYAVMGYDMSFGEASLSGDTITVDGVTINMAGMDPMALDAELTFSGVVENDDGSYFADSLTTPDLDLEFGDEHTGQLTLVDMVAEDLWLPPEGDTSAEALVQLIGRMATGPLTVTRDGAEVIKIAGMEAVSEFAYDADETLESINSDVAITDIWADLSTLGEEEPEAGAIVEALGLTRISGNITQSVNWSMADGRMVFEESKLDFADIGALNFTADISGFTLDMLDKIYAMQASDLDPMSEEAQAQQMMAGMEIAQALSIGATSLRYDDAGLAPKLLDLFAAQSGVERAEFVDSLKAMLPAMIAESGMSALNDVVVPPVSAFLEDPQNLEVAINPPSPTSVLVLAAAAANPAGLIQALGLTVTANSKTK